MAQNIIILSNYLCSCKNKIYSFRIISIIFGTIIEMKVLNGSELAGYIKERQSREAQTLILNHKIIPSLAIILTVDNPIINIYVNLKQKYGHDLGIRVQVYKCDDTNIEKTIQMLNKDSSTHAIIIQLPLFDQNLTDKLVNLVDPKKDVDGLNDNSLYDSATPLAIMWLLAGYNIELKNKKILIIGKGKLVGKPLYGLLSKSELDVEQADRSVKDLKSMTIKSDIIITATGTPALLVPEMLKKGAVIVDAGVASEEGKISGDLDPTVYNRKDLIITPQKGGVGPLTVCALFENVLKAARLNIKTEL